MIKEILDNIRERFANKKTKLPPGISLVISQKAKDLFEMQGIIYDDYTLHPLKGWDLYLHQVATTKTVAKERNASIIVLAYPAVLVPEHLTDKTEEDMLSHPDGKPYFVVYGERKTENSFYASAPIHLDRNENRILGEWSEVISPAEQRPMFSECFTQD